MDQLGKTGVPRVQDCRMYVDRRCHGNGTRIEITMMWLIVTPMTGGTHPVSLGEDVNNMCSRESGKSPNRLDTGMAHSLAWVT